MGWGKTLFKVVQGSAGGLFVVAALPVFGAVGTVTTIGAIVSVVVGGGIGAVEAKNEES
ncbi:hypothetical protein [Photobacterium carnosum]|uniref:hypothetical protein n=1 Tax=Photobacterium carnosum TaxID=2023717 RepID=UPI001E51A08E|nr:hypothetical protein [Photobacterium carnosum]MCD9527534.1 hypothetical protein [Photobacterium carnosum]